MLADVDPALDTSNTEQATHIKNEAEDRNSHRIAMRHDFLEVWQGSQILCLTQKESRAEIKQMTTIGFISDMEDTVNAFFPLFQPGGMAAFTLTE
jgi:hypothetical protein